MMMLRRRGRGMKRGTCWIRSFMMLTHEGSVASSLKESIVCFSRIFFFTIHKLEIFVIRDLRRAASGVNVSPSIRLGTISLIDVGISKTVCIKFIHQEDWVFLDFFPFTDQSSFLSTELFFFST